MKKSKARLQLLPRSRRSRTARRATSPASNTPELNAGTTSPIAGRFASLVIELRRADGSQQFSKVSLTPPPGLVAKLAGTAYCPEAALTAAGAGPSPYWATGEAYLAGPYKGAPLSMAIVTPAVAGPFDLGTVVVRVALDIDPATAKITAVSDPLPEILQGIPLDVRVAQVLIDRPDFTLNGTSCNPLAFSGELTSTLGQTAPLSERLLPPRALRQAKGPAGQLTRHLRGALPGHCHHACAQRQGLQSSAAAA